MVVTTTAFQSTLPQEERRIPGGCGPFDDLFQSTLPQEERLLDIVSAYPPFYFNPRSHKRSDFMAVGNCIPRLLFQSTLPQEERRKVGKVMKFGLNFNPRSHKRSDLTVAGQKLASCISIHAPTRGATLPYDFPYPG